MGVALQLSGRCGMNLESLIKIQASHPGRCLEEQSATTARVAKVLDCDAGTIQCSDNPLGLA